MPVEVPDSDSEDELPPGWEERTAKDGCVYYINHQTKDTQWNHPRTGKKKFVSGDMPYGWEKQIDEANGEFIYVNKEDGRKTYTDPRLAFAVEEKSHRNDFRQRFDSSTTALQVLHGRDLSGKVAVITGCNTGIGFETAYSLAKHGCKILMGCRNMQAANEAINTIGTRKEAAAKLCTALELDLASLKSVKSFAQRCAQLVEKIDMLILNAAVFGLPHSTTIDGFETIFQVNHLSHLYLVMLLLKTSLKSGTRVIFVSSESHRFASFSVPTQSLSPPDLSPDCENFSSMSAYNKSKLCNVLCAKVLANMCSEKGIAVNSLHPGNLVSSNLSRNWWLYRIFFALVRPFTKSLQQAASTTVYCATAVELEGTTGLYFNNCFCCEPSNLSKDDELAKKVFDLCVNMIVRQTGSDEIIQCMK